MKKYILIILFALSLGGLLAQNFACYSEPTIENKKDFIDRIQQINRYKTGFSDFYTIRINCHILRKSDGTGGISHSDVYDAINVLQTAFNSHNICFSLIGINYVNNDFFSSIAVGLPFPLLEETDSLFKSYITPNAIDIFFQPETGPFNGGIAQGFLFPSLPSIFTYNYFNDAVLVGGKIQGVKCINSNILSHEIAHVLGLLHTFESSSFGQEFVNGTNCSYAVDLVCDSPASQGLNWNAGLVNDATCTYLGTEQDINGDFYNPDVHNIMEYSSMRCIDYFSNEQGARMRGFLATEPNLQKLIVPDNLHFSNEVFMNTSLYGVNNIITAENTEIELNANVIFIAGYQVLLEEGFHAKGGSSFQASISDNCNYLNVFNSAKTNNELERMDANNIESLIIYPNPVENDFNVRFKTFEQIETQIELTIFDLLGNKISKEIFYLPKEYSFERHISTSNLSSGVYLIELKYNNKKATKQFVVE